MGVGGGEKDREKERDRQTERERIYRTYSIRIYRTYSIRIYRTYVQYQKHKISKLLTKTEI